MSLNIVNLNEEEIAIKLAEILSHADLFDKSGLDPTNEVLEDSENRRFRTTLLNIFFNEYRVIEYPEILDISEEKLQGNEYVIEHNGVGIKKLRIDVKIVDSFTANKIEQNVEQLKSEYKTDILVEKDESRIPVSGRLIVKYKTNQYKKELLAKHSFWKESVKPKIRDAIVEYQEKQDAVSRENFKKDFFKDKKRFADGLIIYCEILRNLYDVTKIADRFIRINKWMRGEKDVKSQLMCLFNTRTGYGQNGKTRRCELEKRYLKENGFSFSTDRLFFNHCSDKKVFAKHLYYNDEYAFETDCPEQLKKIHNNIAPHINTKVLYKGDFSFENEAMFYLSANNGKPSDRVLNNDRMADWIRITDAWYEQNKGKLTTIYTDRPSEEVGLLNQICYKDLFDALFKSACEYNQKKVITKPTKGLEVSSILIEIIEAETQSKAADGKDKTGFYTIFRKLNKSHLFPREKATQALKEIYDYFAVNYPNLIIINQTDPNRTPNWMDNSLKLWDGNVTAVHLLELANGQATIDISEELLDREELKRYIYDLYDLDVNLPFENPHSSIKLEEIQAEYTKQCNSFIPVTRTKIEREYTDKKGEHFELLYEGVNKPKGTASDGHVSRFSNDNMCLMPRFLVEYDAQKDSSKEEIEQSKQEMIKLAEKWPTFRVVDSGNKSIHCLFCFDLESVPKNVDQFKFAVKEAVKQLGLPEKIGCAVLDQNTLTDPSRITRRPGVVRENGNLQSLISFNKNKIHVDWQDKYEENENNKIMEEKEAKKLRLLMSSVFGDDFESKSKNVEKYVNAYMLKYGLVWVEGQRHSVASKIAGACNLAGFTAEECVSTLQNMYPNDCSADPSILSNLGKYFDK